LAQDTRVDPSANHNYALQLACFYGHKETVHFLLSLPTIDPSDNDNNSIQFAVSSGHTCIVEMLLKDPRTILTPSAIVSCLITCSENNDTATLQILLKDKRFNPSLYDNRLIQEASSQGKAEIVQILLRDERVNPTANSDFAIKMAKQNGHDYVVKLLQHWYESIFPISSSSSSKTEVEDEKDEKSPKKRARLL
jgi:ankyrin repeat protein